MIPLEQMENFVRKSLDIPTSAQLVFIPLAVRGSERSFFRVAMSGGNSAIVVVYNPVRVENSYYADIAVFLSSINVTVPIVFGHDPELHIMVMEDVGNTDLWSFRTLPWKEKRTLYYKTLEVVHRLHSFPAKDFPSGKIKLMDGFDMKLYRWEHGYFREHFVEKACGIVPEPSRTNALEDELAALADRIGRTDRCLIHRDLQSQNVMMREGRPYLIDFQGMRLGSMFYDLGSLLNDPYMMLSEGEVLELLDYYYSLSEKDVEWAFFMERFWEASVQRLMQALGAYGFLGKTKGLKTFLDHIPAGLIMLRRAITHTPTVPVLKNLIEECRMALRL